MLIIVSGHPHNGRNFSVPFERLNNLSKACYLKSRPLFIWASVVVLGCLECCCAMDLQAKGPEPRRSGGPCEYKVYEGTARITSIRKKEMPQGYPGPSHESYEVRFSFQSNKRIQEPYAQVEAVEHTLKLTNSWYPGPEFLARYGIEEGGSFECRLRVITKGTCTPLLFDFPEIDLSDYFESRK